MGAGSHLEPLRLPCPRRAGQLAAAEGPGGIAVLYVQEVEGQLELWLGELPLEHLRIEQTDPAAADSASRPSNIDTLLREALESRGAGGGRRGRRRWYD